jgi:hypothetical protein
MARRFPIVRVLPTSIDPANNVAARGYIQVQRRERIDRPAGATDREDPQPRSPHWPPGDEAREPYPLMPPVAPLNGKQSIARTCDVCGNHFPLLDAAYYEHMKTYHPWAPRSYKHGDFRPPGDAEHIQADDPARYNASLPDLDMGKQPTPAQLERITNANQLAQDLGFDLSNPDGPPGFSVNEVEKKVMLTMYGLDTFAPEELEPNTFRIGRIIEPTYKNGTPIGRTIFGNSLANRRALRSEGLLPPETIRGGFNVGSLVLYRNAPGEALPWFRNLNGRDAYIPWRMIQPLHRPFGLPVNVPMGNGLPLPISTVFTAGSVSNGLDLALSDSSKTWNAETNEVLLQLQSDAKKTRVMDFERRRGDYNPKSLAARLIDPWGVHIDLEWLRNHINDQNESNAPAGDPKLPRSKPTTFRLGRIIAPLTKGGVQVNRGSLSVTAQDTDNDGNVSYNDFIKLSQSSAEDALRTRWSIGSLVLYLDDEDHPHPRFRDVYGKDRQIPSIMVQKIYRPFDLSENLPLVEEGVGLPIVAAARDFTVTNALDFEMLPCRNWEARKDELLLRTDPKKYNPRSEAGEDIQVTDYERKSGEVSGEGTWTHVTDTPWGVRVNLQVLQRHFQGWTPQATPPRSSSPTPNNAQTSAASVHSAQSATKNQVNTNQTNNNQASIIPPAPNVPAPSTLAPFFLLLPPAPSTSATSMVPPAGTGAPVPVYASATNPPVTNVVPPAGTGSWNAPPPPVTNAVPLVPTINIIPATSVANNNPSSPTDSFHSARSTTAIPLLLTSDFQDYVAEIDQMQTSHTFVANTATSIRAYIENHVKELQSKNLIEETQATADWRPDFWTRQSDILDRAPLGITLPADIQAVKRLLELSNKLKISGQASPPSPKGKPGQKKYFTRAELLDILAEFKEMQKNNPGEDTYYTEMLDDGTAIINFILDNFWADQTVNKEDDAMVAQRTQYWAVRSSRYKSLNTAGKIPKGVSGLSWSKLGINDKAFSSVVVQKAVKFKDPTDKTKKAPTKDRA